MCYDGLLTRSFLHEKENMYSIVSFHGELISATTKFQANRSLVRDRNKLIFWISITSPTNFFTLPSEGIGYHFICAEYVGMCLEADTPLLLFFTFFVSWMKIRMVVCMG